MYTLKKFLKACQKIMYKIQWHRGSILYGIFRSNILKIIKIIFIF